MHIDYRWILGACLTLLAMSTSAKTYDSVGALEQALSECQDHATSTQATCLSEAVTSDGLKQQRLAQEIYSWQEIEKIVSIFPISTNVVVENLLINKSVRLATRDRMAIINLQISADHTKYRVNKFSLVSGESSVMDNVCGSSCHS
ncbi:hypothetical protein ACPUEJ_22170 [Vibrio tubiashii]|uniref:hypothetical protein n=1 Tax=Vibrio tubiashii TaxID=29498 RepID=UPI003CE4C6B2